MDYAVLKKNFENHRFHTSYFETKEEAAAYLSDQIKGEKVGFGGSITAKEMNLFEVLRKDNEVIWHWEQGPDARIKAKDSTVYILSANAAAGTGCKDPGKKRIYRIHTERKCRCRDRTDHQHRRDRKPSFRELIWTETSILCDREK